MNIVEIIFIGTVIIGLLASICQSIYNKTPELRPLEIAIKWLFIEGIIFGCYSLCEWAITWPFMMTKISFIIMMVCLALMINLIILGWAKKVIVYFLATGFVEGLLMTFCGFIPSTAWCITIAGILTLIILSFTISVYFIDVNNDETPKNSCWWPEDDQWPFTCCD